MRHFSTNEGLPSNEIYQVVQDKQGYIWFGTNYGASRFDGYHFKNYDSQNGLPDNTILEVYPDDQGRMWFISNSLKLSFISNGKITEYPFNKNFLTALKDKPGLLNRSFYADNEGNIYIGIYYYGIYKISNTGKVSLFFKDAPEKNSIHEMFCKAFVNSKLDGNNDFYIYRNYKKTNYNINRPNTKISAGIRLAYLCKNGDILYSENSRLFCLKKNGTVCIYDFPNVKVLSLDPDHEGNMWVSTYGDGAYCFAGMDITKKPVHHLFKGKIVTSVCADHENGLWFTTLIDGAYYLTGNWVASYTKESGLSDNNIQFIAEGSLCVYAATNNRNLNVVLDDTAYYSCITASTEMQISALQFDKNNSTLFIGTNRNLRMMREGKISEIPVYYNARTNKAEKTPYITNDIFRVADNSYYLGTNRGLLSYDSKKILFYPSGKIFNRITSLETYDGNSLCYGGMDGLYQFKDSIYFKTKNTVIPNVRITYVRRNPYDSSLWLATKGNGIFILKHNYIFQLQKKDGLSSNFVKHIVFSHDAAWTSTNNGVCKIILSESDKNIYTFQIYNKDKGLISNEIFRTLVIGNKVFAATDKGISVFNPSTIKKNTHAPPVYITNIKIIDRDTCMLKHYDLSHDQNFITFSFIGLCYKKAGDVSYKYRMKGLDNEWRETKSPQMQFPYLPPGDYVFTVKAINEDGIESTVLATVSITIHSPFWKTWWFLILFFVIIVSVISGIFLLRMREMKRREKLQQQLMTFRQQALSSQMNPHFIFNSLNSIQHFILENDVKSSNKYLTKFSHLMRATLNNSQHMAIPIEDEINALTLYLELESLRFSQRFDFTIEVDPDINTKNTLIPTLLIQPYVENSIWHGLMHKEDKGKIEIELKLRNDIIICAVTDNGIGREKAGEIKRSKIKIHQSMGTKITEKRLELINSLYGKSMNVIYTDLRDAHGTSCGTRVEITLPILKDDEESQI